MAQLYNGAQRIILLDSPSCPACSTPTISRPDGVRVECIAADRSYRQRSAASAVSGLDRIESAQTAPPTPYFFNGIRPFLHLGERKHKRLSRVVTGPCRRTRKQHARPSAEISATEVQPSALAVFLLRAATPSLTLNDAAVFLGDGAFHDEHRECGGNAIVQKSDLVFEVLDGAFEFPAPASGLCFDPPHAGRAKVR